MNQQKATSKLMLAVIAAVLTAGVILFLYFYIGVKQRRNTYEDSKWIAIHQSRHAAIEVEQFFIRAIMVARSLKNQSLIYFKSGADRLKIVDLVKTTLQKNSDFLAIWTMWEPQYYKSKGGKSYDSNYSDSAGNFQFTFFYFNGNLFLERVSPDMYQEDYYTIPRQTMQEMVLEPFFYKYQGYPYNFYETSVVVPIVLDSSFVGVFGVDIDLVSLQKKLSGIKLYNKGYISLISPKGEIVAHKDSSYITKNFFEVASSNDTVTPYIIRNGLEYSYETVSEFSGEEVFRTFYPIRIGDSFKQWSIMVEISKKEATYRSSQLQYVALVVLILGLLLISYLIYNIFDRIKYEKELIAAKEKAEKSENNLQRMYYELQTSEEELRATNEELWATTEALKENNIQLQQAKEKAEESSRLKTAFLQNLSHEVRTPLNAICGFAQHLSNSGSIDQEKDSYIRIILNSSKQLLTIISDIITISSLETGQVKVNSINIRLNSIINDLQTSYQALLKGKPVLIQTSKAFADGRDEIVTDNLKLTQILDNLLSNAVKFTNEGIIELGYKVRDGFLEFWVSDTGIGIDKKKQEIIFDRFVQADEQIHINYGGTGLGLSICKGFVELLGGKIWVESEPGKGATFFFTIPYLPVKKEKAEPLPKQSKDAQSATFNILVAEDDEYSFRLLKALLKDHNCQIVHARNGQEAVEFCKADESICLVFMDIKMPVMDGVTATKLIREFRPNLTVIAQTAYATLDDIEKNKNVFNAYITKPIDVEKFKKVLDEFCDKLDNMERY